MTKLQDRTLDDVELLTNTLNIYASHIAFMEEILSHNDYKTLFKLKIKFCVPFSNIQSDKFLHIIDGHIAIRHVNAGEVCGLEMRGINGNIKKTFFEVVKTNYHEARHVAYTPHV